MKLCASIVERGSVTAVKVLMFLCYVPLLFISRSYLKKINFIDQENILDNVLDAEFEALPTKEYLQKMKPSHQKKIAAAFSTFRDNDIDAAVLNITGIAINPSASSNYLLTWHGEHGSPRTILGRLDPNNAASLFCWRSDRESSYRHVECNSLPFVDGEFDWVFCDGVIEHVGGFERQYLLLRELMRVSKKGIFLTTSNRRHPIEFYTALPFLHWLPATWWRRSLKWLGKGAWATDSGLNLLNARELQRLVALLPGKPECSIGHIRLLGLKAYFFLQIKRPISLEKQLGN